MKGPLHDSDEGKNEPEDMEDIWRMACMMSEHVHDKSVDQLNGDSEEEDERGVFDYEDLEEHIMENNDEDDGEDDLEESDFGAEDGEGAVDNEDDYNNYEEY